MAAPAGSNRLAAMVMIDHRPQEQPDIPASEQLTVAKGELVEVLHRNFETQWWDCRLAVPALAGVKWSAETHTRTGQLSSGWKHTLDATASGACCYGLLQFICR